METAAISAWIEDKVAPEPLLAIQALANSQASEDDPEQLVDATGSREWLTGFGLLAPGAEVSEEGRKQLVELRRCVRALIDANMTGDQDEAASAELARIAARHPVPVQVGADGTIDVDLEPAASVDALIAQMIGIVLRAQIDGSWERLKICAADSCRWAFFDVSKNRGGHWCSMEVCGNREKNRAYRERKSSAATS
jgi:predicted RNA-binding Zn ribbon-like protein